MPTRNRRTARPRPSAAAIAVRDPSGPLVRVERRGPVAVLTLDHPPVNVLTRALLGELARNVLACVDDPSVRAVVIASALSGFSGGADIKLMAGMSRDEASAFSRQGQALANLIERAPIPIIAAVNGFCFGGGSELSQACDFIVASEDTVFGQPEILIGVLPGWGGSRRLTRAVGVARARRWILTGEKVPVQAAFEHGLVDRIVPRERLLDEAVGFAQELARQPAVALAAAKYAVNDASDPSRLMGLEFERELWSLLFEAHDQREGMRAFLEKRPPVFTDRRDGESPGPRFPWELPGSPLEVAKEGSRELEAPSLRGPSTGARPVPFDLLAMADMYRETGLRAFEAFFALMRNLNDSYRFWAEQALVPVRPTESSKD